MNWVEAPSSHLQSLTNTYVIVAAQDNAAQELLVPLLKGAGAIVLAVTSMDEVLQVLSQLIPSLIVCTLGRSKEDFLSIKTVRSLSIDSGGRVPAIAVVDGATAHIRDEILLAGYQACLSGSEVRTLVQTAARLAQRTR